MFLVLLIGRLIGFLIAILVMVIQRGLIMFIIKFEFQTPWSVLADPWKREVSSKIVA
jgi:hypothetical protein